MHDFEKTFYEEVAGYFAHAPEHDPSPQYAQTSNNLADHRCDNPWYEEDAQIQGLSIETNHMWSVPAEVTNASLSQSVTTATCNHSMRSPWHNRITAICSRSVQSSRSQSADLVNADMSGSNVEKTRGSCSKPWGTATTRNNFDAKSVCVCRVPSGRQECCNVCGSVVCAACFLADSPEPVCLNCA